MVIGKSACPVGYVRHTGVQEYGAAHCRRKEEERCFQTERYVTVEDAAKQMHVQPITLQRWLAIGTMPQYGI